MAVNYIGENLRQSPLFCFCREDFYQEERLLSLRQDLHPVPSRIFRQCKFIEFFSNKQKNTENIPFLYCFEVCAIKTTCQ